MPIGVIVNCLSVVLGGAVGAVVGKKLSDGLKENITVLFGFCSFSVGINSVIKASSMTPVILAVLLGFVLGQLLHIEDKTTDFFKILVPKLHLGGKNIDMDLYITAVALFCCSGFGWYGALTEGMVGDPTLLLSKAVLDFFTALVFAASLGLAVCAIPLPQFVILVAVFGAGKLLAGVIGPSMFADFTACGGILTLAAALRVTKIKSIPVVDLIPALLLVLPLSAGFTMLMG